MFREERLLEQLTSKSLILRIYDCTYFTLEADNNMTLMKSPEAARENHCEVQTIQAENSQPEFQKQNIAALPAEQPPKTISDITIPETFLANLLLKQAFYLEVFTLLDMTSLLKLNSAITLHLIDYLRREKYIEVRGSANLNGAATSISQNYRYSLNNTGKNRASQLFEFDNYVGPAPVSLEDYWRQVEGQSIKDFQVHRHRLEQEFIGLVISETLVDQLGPAVVSGKPIFIYGPPGNGKTAISLRLGGVMDDPVMVPYALYVEGNVIRVFDEVTHRPVTGESESLFKADGRWVKCQRPTVVVGGEMTLEMMDLSFNPILKYYEAPLQLKANNGLFIVDDFGRQRIPPQELLNRWIIPMENRRDFLCLHTGQKFAVPFDQLIIFSTNLEPESLVDAAFLRRLRHKIKLDHINQEQFRAIFRGVCNNYQLEYSETVVNYLLATYYDPFDRPMDACHPRDLVEQIIDIAKFLEITPQLTPENIDRACKTYFVE